ncbi:TonB-dependent receptor [Chromobacterium violaceum]|uniref:TonB-dependent receptor n=1 Tax=Chromobacterium violaceum TaxID=536 RepID=UPI0012FD323C|nr:TonB-dependent receptor [Chromobacterium violaceum]
MFKLQTCAALTALACSGLALADGVPQFVGDPVIVTASRIAQPLSKTLADATVITRDEIEESGAQTLQQVLSRQAAVSITTNGGPGTSSSIFMRGTNSNHTVVLVDGMRISSATTGTTAIQNISLEQIERIEILRGPASSLYGADAIGGVIQIFTRTGEGAPRFNAGFEAGSRGTGKATIRGLTLEGATVVAGVDLGANLTLLDARDDGTGHWLERRPRQSANFTASKELGKWTLGAEQQIVSRRYDDPANTEAKALHGYGVTNAFANYRFARNWTATARVDNLFDREYETAYGYNTGGLGAFIGVRYSQ